MYNFISIGSGILDPRGSNFTLSHWLCEWLLQQCYALTCYTVSNSLKNISVANVVHVQIATDRSSVKKITRFKNTQKCTHKSTGLNTACDLYSVIKLIKIIEASWLYLYFIECFNWTNTAIVNRRRIGSGTQAFQWHQFQWSWVTSNPDFKVTMLFNVK